MSFFSFTDISLNSDLQSPVLNSMLAELENYLSGITASADITITGDMDAATFKIGGTEVLSSTALGSSVVVSSLTSVGSLTSLVITGDLTVDTNTLYVDSINDNVGIRVSSVPINKTLSVYKGLRIDADGDLLDPHIHIVPDSGEGDSWAIGIDDTGNRFCIQRGVSDGSTVFSSPEFCMDIAGNAIFTGSITCKNTTDSSSTTTGSMQIDGGMGIVKNLRVGGTVSITDSFSELTISSGVVTATKSIHQIDTEGNASTDDLDTINGGSYGDILILTPEAGTRTVVVKDNIGNLRLNGDFTIDDSTDRLLLYSDGTLWYELSRSNNE